MIIEHRTYKIKPGKLNELMDLYEKEGMEVHKKILGNQIGYFYTEIGPLNEIVHLYGYESLDDRAQRRKKLAENEIWQKYLFLSYSYLFLTLLIITNLCNLIIIKLNYLGQFK